MKLAPSTGLFVALIFLVIAVMIGTIGTRFAAAETRIEEVKVLDHSFAVVRVVNTADQLSKAQELWDSLVPIDALPDTDWTHKLDIRSDSIGGRWLYSEEGYIARLNYRLKPKYKVPDVKSFNAIFLGP